MTKQSLSIASIKNTPSTAAYDLSVDIRTLDGVIRNLYRNGMNDTAEWDDVASDLDAKVVEWEKLTGVDWNYL